MSASLVLISLSVLAFLSGCGDSKVEAQSKKQAQAPAAPVTVTEARRQDIPLEVRGIGNVEAYRSVDVKSQVAGRLDRVYFQEGQDVREGQLLFLIDQREFQQAVREAEAALANQKAAIGQVEANHQRDVATARNARADAQRFQDLAEKGIISRSQNEQYQTTATAAEKAAAASAASIESARAALQGSEAKLADARLQLSYATIRAPMAGLTGNVTLRQGSIIAVNGQTPLVTINQITPIYVTFDIPEQSLDQIRRFQQGGKRLKVLAYPQQTAGPPPEGVLDFLDNQVDPSTGTIRLKGRFPNTDRRLWPGQFVNVALQLELQSVVAVPSAAVHAAQNGSYVFVIQPGLTAEQRTVQPARTWNDITVIDSGLRPGERVVLDGALRLRSGAKVRVVNQSSPVS